jgi:hypothetical protein
MAQAVMACPWYESERTFGHSSLSESSFESGYLRSDQPWDLSCEKMTRKGLANQTKETSMVTALACLLNFAGIVDSEHFKKCEPVSL